MNASKPTPQLICEDDDKPCDHWWLDESQADRMIEVMRCAKCGLTQRVFYERCEACEGTGAASYSGYLYDGNTCESGCDRGRVVIKTDTLVEPISDEVKQKFNDFERSRLEKLNRSSKLICIALAFFILVLAFLVTTECVTML